jgi:glycosyltransferase involved in cell wall biosynthesis
LFLISKAQSLLFIDKANQPAWPMLQAIRFGVPVIISQGGSLAEIAAGSAILIDPHDRLSLSLSIDNVVKKSEIISCISSNMIESISYFSLDSFQNNLKYLYKLI